MRYATTHEYGHVVAFSMSEASTTELIERMVHLGGGNFHPDDPSEVQIDTHDMTDVLSSYGATHPHEAFAEGWAEYRLSESPRKMATLIGTFMEMHMGETVLGPVSGIRTKQQMILAIQAAGDDLERQAALIAKCMNVGWFDVVPPEWDEGLDLAMDRMATEASRPHGLVTELGPLPPVIVWKIDGSGEGAGCIPTDDDDVPEAT
jgi:hypothetical protein